MDDKDTEVGASVQIGELVEIDRGRTHGACALSLDPPHRNEVVAVNDLRFEEALALMDLVITRAAARGMTTQQYFARWAVGDNL